MAVITGSCGVDMTYSFDDSAPGPLTITHTPTTTWRSGWMTDYSFDESNRPPWYAYRELITSVSLPDTILRVGNNAFKNCTGLTGTLTIPDGCETVGGGAFYGCTGLTGTLAIPPSMTVIWEYCFQGCTGLTGLSLPEGLTNIATGAFSGCTGFTGELVLPSTLVKIEGGDGDRGAFYNCSGFTGTLTIPAGCNISGNCVFKGCSGLEELVIQGGTSQIGFFCFQDCTGLQRATFGPDVTDIFSGAFQGCTSMTEATFTSAAPPDAMYRSLDTGGSLIVDHPDTWAEPINDGAFYDYMEYEENPHPPMYHPPVRDEFSSRVFADGAWHGSTAYILIGGAWHECVPYVLVSNRWRS